jgi:hypothetical protein
MRRQIADKGWSSRLEVETNMFLKNKLLQSLYMVEFCLLGYNAMLSG